MNQIDFNKVTITDRTELPNSETNLNGYEQISAEESDEDNLVVDPNNQPENKKTEQLFNEQAVMATSGDTNSIPSTLSDKRMLQPDFI